MNGGLQNAGVAKHGQRRKIQSLVLQRSASSNLVPCIFLLLVFTSLFPLIVSILIKAKTTQHDEVRDYKHITIEFRYKEPIPIQGYTPNLKQ